PAIFPADFHTDRPAQINGNIDNQREYLPEARCKRGPLDSQRRKWSQAKNQNRIQNDISDTPTHQAKHSYFHSSDCLENFFKGHSQNDGKSKQKNNDRITDSQIDYFF